MADESKVYTNAGIEVLEGLEPVRRRPGMYVGDVHDGTGLHHLLWEVVANSIDEHLAGHASCMRVSVEGDLAEVEDDGRGIPVEFRPELKKSALELILTCLHSGATLDGHTPHVHVSPLHGVGLAAVNALSAELEIEVRRDGYSWRQRYERGIPVTGLERGPRTDRTGTRIRFRPDPTIFTCTDFDVLEIRARLGELALFNSSLEIEFMSERIREPKGFAGWIDHLAESREIRSYGDVLAVRKMEDLVIVDVALAWAPGQQGALWSFAGQHRTIDGGTHERGFWSGIAHAIAAQPESGLRRPPGASKVRERIGGNLLAAVHVCLLDPRFSGPTRDRLATPCARAAVRKVVASALTPFLAEHPELARTWIYRLRR